MNVSLSRLVAFGTFSSSPLLKISGNLHLVHSIFHRCFCRVVFSCESFRIQSSSFRSLLTAPIVEQSILLVSERYVNPVSSVEGCYFAEISGTSLGGAIYSDLNSLLTVSDCSFRLIHTTNQAGVIYKKDGSISLNRNCFYLCYSSYQINNYGGNVMYTYNSELNLNMCTALECWNSTSICAESNMRIYYKCMTFKNYNSSYCKGSNNGGIIGEFWSLSSGSTISFCMSYKGEDTRCICNTATSNSLQIDYCNFIENTVTYLLDDTKVSASYCSFFGNTVKTSYFRSTTLSNCVGDFSATGMVKTTITLQSQSSNPAIRCQMTEIPTIARKCFNKCQSVLFVLLLL